MRRSKLSSVAFAFAFAALGMGAVSGLGGAVTALALADAPHPSGTGAVDAGPRRRIRIAPERLGLRAPLAVDAAISSAAPDPTPLRAREQWVFDLKWHHGDVYLLGMHPLALDEPRETPRVMGRFALELYEGRTLLERVRFDFPLLGSDSAAELRGRHAERDASELPRDPQAHAGDAGADGGVRRPLASRSPIRLEPKLSTRIGVFFPNVPRGTRLELWDRLTGERYPLPWPPWDTRTAGDGDGGAEAPAN